MFWPDDGVLLLEVPIDVSRYDQIWITEEVVGPAPSVPNTNGPSWFATLNP
jgi:hypothetical protein